MNKIPFNKPYLTGKEGHYIYQAVLSGKISGDGVFTKKCHQFFEEKYNFKKVLLTTSCTDALEMAALLINIHPGDEVIMPSYTFVSTANAFVLRGAKIVFADSCNNNPNIDVDHIASLINPQTKAIVVVHYAGIACDMDRITALVKAHNLYLIEDAAQAIDSFHNGKPLGSFGHLAAFSFHETKNIISGEGGMLVINDDEFAKRAEIIREKGTNRSAFFRGEIDKYGWVDIGSSFLPSDIISAFLFAQLENLEQIQNKRKHIWELYHRLLQPLAASGKIILPYLPDYATNNAHMFYIVTHKFNERERIISELKKNDILSVFHYLSLHKSEFYKSYNPEVAASSLPMCDHYSDCLLRLPFYFELTDEDVIRICAIIVSLYQ
jgi:dTDP-4-amino-4,6-dideoxygalactose transaminase